MVGVSVKMMGVKKKRRRPCNNNTRGCDDG